MTSPDEQPPLTEAILLVAGTGSRLSPLTDDCPKCLLEVSQKPLLRRLLEQLVEAGIERVVFSTGYLHDRLMDTVRAWELPLTMVEAYGETYDRENNAVSLGVAMKALNGHRFLLCDGDILLRDASPLTTIVDAPHDNAMALMRFEEMGDEEMKMVVDDDHRIDTLGKDIPLEQADGESLGIQKIGPSAFDALQQRLQAMDAEERRVLYYEDVFTHLIDQGIPFFGCELAPEGWTEIDTVDDLEAARQLAETWPR